MISLVLLVFGFWAVIFLVFFVANGTSASEVFLGELEPLPERLGEWIELASLSSGELVEERHLLLGEGKSGVLVRQRRFRDPNTREIVRIEPEERVIRRRRKRADAEGASRG